jgi:hypothetical protein
MTDRQLAVSKHGNACGVQEMIESLSPPQEVLDFDIEKFVKGLGYAVHETVTADNVFLIPPNEPTIPGDGILGPLEPGDML